MPSTSAEAYLPQTPATLKSIFVGFDVLPLTDNNATIDCPTRYRG